MDFGISFWPALAHLIEESGIIKGKKRKSGLYAMNGMKVPLKETIKIAAHLRYLLANDKRDNFILPEEKIDLHGLKPLLGGMVCSIYRERIEQFINFCDQAENGFKIE